MDSKIFFNIFSLVAILLITIPNNSEGSPRRLDESFITNLAVPTNFWENSNFLATLAQIGRSRNTRRIEDPKNTDRTPSNPKEPAKPKFDAKRAHAPKFVEKEDNQNQNSVLKK